MDYYEDSEAYGDYQGSEEYQYHYDGDDYPEYGENYTEEQVSCFNLDVEQLCSCTYFTEDESEIQKCHVAHTLKCCLEV